MKLPFARYTLATLLLISIPGFSQKKLNLKQFVDDQTSFIHRELQTHLSGLNSPENTPDSLFGVSIKGDFAFTHLMLALELDRQVNAGKNSKHDYSKWIEGLLVKDADGTTFAQLFAMQTRHAQKFGLELKQQEPSQTSEKIFAAMSDIRKFYDPATETIVNNRPPNYFAVALFTGALAYANGYELDKPMLMRLLQKCISLLQASGNYLSDDNSNENARYDRYGMEYSIFLYQSAKLLDAEREMEELKPYVKYSGELWWTMLDPQKGFAFQYGRSLQNTWDDSMEQVGFFLENPELAPTSPAELAGVFVQAWQHYLQNQYNEQMHLNRMLDDGRGTYSYAGRNRIWGYTVGTFAKALRGFSTLKSVVESGKLTTIDSKPKKHNITTFIPYRTSGKPAGVWIVKNNQYRIMVPFTDGLGNKPNSDYLSGLYGVDGIGWPVSQSKGFLVPEIQTSQNQTFILSGRPDSLYVTKDDNEVIAIWNQLKHEAGNKQLACKITGRWKRKKTGVRANFKIENLPADAEQLSLNAWFNNEYSPKNSTSMSAKERSIQFSHPFTIESPTVNEKGAFCPLRQKVISVVKPKSGEKWLEIGYEITFK